MLQFSRQLILIFLLFLFISYWRKSLSPSNLPTSAGRCPASRWVWWYKTKKEVTSWLIFLSAQPLAHGFGAVLAPALSAKWFLPLGTQTPPCSELMLLHQPGTRNAEAPRPGFMGSSARAAARRASNKALASCLKCFRVPQCSKLL